MGKAIMSSRALVFVACAVMTCASGWASAQNLPADEPTQTTPAKTRSAKAKRPASATTNAKPPAKAEPPCARGAWKDDPICFGEGDADALPTPSAGSGEHVGAGKSEAIIKPMVNLNSRSSGAGVIYKPDGNAVTSDYGAGVSLHLPFSY